MGIIVSILNVTQLLGECTALMDNTDKQVLNPSPAEPGYALPLETV